MPFRSRRRGLAASVAAVLAIVASVVVAPSLARADGPTTFSNPAPIAIPAAGAPDQTGPASPYPSTIAVSGMAGLVTKVQVVFTGLTHSTLNDVDAMVVAPSGQNLVVLSDVGDPNTLAFTNNATLTFDDAAASGVPTGNVPSGTYRPTNTAGVEAFPAPAPGPSAQTTLAGAFTGINPNGNWQLFIVDDTSGDIGSMAGGWSLVITTEQAAVATTTVVTTSGSPSATGAPVTFTATVTAAGGPVTGTVAFTADGAPLGTVALNAAGIAQVTTSTLTEGTHAIVGTYSGSTGFLASNGSVSQRVDNPTTVTGTTYCNPGSLTVPANGPAAPYPSNITVTGLTAPVTKVTATLNGVSHAVPVDLDVLLSGPVPTTNVMLMSDVGGTSPVSGATIVFDDAAAGPVPTPLASGTFRPTDDDADAADAAFPAPAPVVSPATTLATFNGTSANGVWSLWVVDDASGDAGSISGGWCLTFTTASPTATTLTSSVNPSTFGQSVTFTATVTADGQPVSTGTVAFADGVSPLAAAVPLSASGTATFTTSTLAVGSHTVTSTYSGDAGLSASDATVTQVVDLAPTTTTITSSVNPSVVGQAVTLTATVTAGGSPVPTGTVAFFDGVIALGAPVALAPDGTATFTTSAFAEGTHPISAVYSGSPAYATSTGNLIQAVLPPVVADAGGPYSVAEGAALTLDGSGSSPGATYAWDLNADGDFTDATGPTPTLNWAELEALGIDDGPSTHTITLRVTLGQQEATDSTSLDVVNTAPDTVVTGGLTATVGVPFTIKVGADDPSSADMAASFTYTVDWGDGSPVVSVVGPADPPITHTYAAAGTYTASLTSTDKDGGTGAPLEIQVVVTAAPVVPPAEEAPPVAAPAAGGLPVTGADPTGPALGAALLLLAGASLLVIGRYRRTRRS
ncbi:Ig-like domain repeat protein [Microbacterium sp. 4R-513]|uniref:Ig-like domain repeat protein n=1 Tax=Microbacterium sp. 4R-513 TaxID=2567934 RepID=UPI0013E1C605|nr:Ig-like domain repeat protein [Microbacterium sp. 4R-513]QIG39691.1 Ig-like domain repeat protein [Microbacterium sp. 4R-513]